MRTVLRLLLVVLVLAVPTVGLAQTTSSTSTSTSTSSSTSTSTSLAVTWLVVRNTDCTGAQAASGLTTATVNCCTASGQGFCEKVYAVGTQFTQAVTIVSTSSQGYTTGGDALNTANLNKIKIANIEAAQCHVSTKGHGVVPLFTSNNGKRGLKLALWDGTTQIGSAADISNTALECQVAGH